MIVRTIFIAAMMWLLPVMGVSQTMQEKLYYTCKVWGFVKYYHSEVSVCNVNWDSVLLDVLPDVRAAASSTQFNDALIHMINAAGPMAIAPTPFPDVLPIELKRNRDWSWISSSSLRADVQAKLNLIKDNFRPHPICWVKRNDYTTPNTGWLLFPKDSLGLNMNTTVTYPSIDQRLLMFYKYWNIIRYFNPYNYVLDTPWDTTLMHYGEKIANAPNAYELFLRYMRVMTKLDDAHVYGLSGSVAQQRIPGFYSPRIKVQFIGEKYTVVRSLEPGIYKGDIIVSVDGKSMSFWEDSLKQYYSAGRQAVLRRIMCDRPFGRQIFNTKDTLVVTDSLGVNHTHIVSCISPGSDLDFFNSTFYPNDSLKDIAWTKMPCNIGYINMGIITNAQVNSMYNDLKTTDAIIIDLRQYPNQTAGTIANKLFYGFHEFAKGAQPDEEYPGTNYWYHDSVKSYSPAPFPGKVILLMNEHTQSQGEYSCMVFEPFSNVIKVGSQTAGADGNLTMWSLSKDIYACFSTIGIYYPNGDSTQRIGIVPDTVIYPTIVGVRRNRDELLEKALKIAGCDIFPPITSGVAEAQQEYSISVYPNPANTTVTISMAQAADVSITITDVAGKIMLAQQLNNTATTTMSISQLSPGMYFVNVRHEGQQYVTKLVKE